MKGKITYKGEPKQFTKGFGLGIKVEGFDDFINFFGWSIEELNKKVPFKVGDFVYVEYERTENGKVNGKLIKPVVFDTPTTVTSLAPPIKTADELETDEEFVGKSVVQAETIFEALQTTKLYDHIKDDKRAVVELVRAISWSL